MNDDIKRNTHTSKSGHNTSASTSNKKNTQTFQKARKLSENFSNQKFEKPYKEGSWHCFPCHTGLLALNCSSSNWYEKYIEIQPKNHPGVKEIGFHIPSARNSDQYLFPCSLKIDKVTDAAPLSIQLTDIEIEAINAAETGGVFAATAFGPISDKESNEDFALSSIFQLGKETFRFAAIADGVSTKTLWPARASRISALVALRTVQKELANTPSKLFNNSFLERLRDKVNHNIIAYLQKDKEFLIKGEYFSTKSSQDYQNSKHNVDSVWYNTTLLYSCIGENGGFVIWIGDGGVAIKKTDFEGNETTVEPLRSTDDVKISSFISLSGKGANAQMANLENAVKSNKSIQIFLSSDGVDRTLSINGLKYEHYVSKHISSTHIGNTLNNFSNDKYMQDKGYSRDNDNYSLAIINWGSSHKSRNSVKKRKDNFSNNNKKENELNKILTEIDSYLNNIKSYSPDNVQKTKRSLLEVRNILAIAEVKIINEYQKKNNLNRGKKYLTINTILLALLASMIITLVYQLFDKEVSNFIETLPKIYEQTKSLVIDIFSKYQ